MHGDGGNTQPNQPHRLMAGGVPASAFPQPISRGRETAGQHPDVSGQFGKLNFSSFFAVASPPSPWKRIPFLKVKCCISLHWTSPPGLCVYGMRAPPKSLLVSGAHAVMTIDTRRTLRFSQPLTVWYRAGARWRRSGIPPIISWICLGPYCRHSSCIS
ncbi:mitochondrial processing peptide beta subunit [Trypanosoma cruzi]|nr:mitochondrial processing peptide beta subunit [Trypanosoma cruzi]